MERFEISEQARKSRKYPGHHEVFDSFEPFAGEMPLHFMSDFIGTRTREGYDRAVNARTDPVVAASLPPFGEEYFEWVEILDAVRHAKSHFVMIEVGAGWGKWSARGCLAARMRGIGDIRLGLVEAEPSHAWSIPQHMADNDILPSDYDLFEAAVGGEEGKIFFAVGKPDGWTEDGPVDWYGQAVVSGEAVKTDVKYACRPVFLMPGGWKAIEIPLKPLSEIVENYQTVDLIDMDIQGAEAVAVLSSLPSLNERVRRLHVGTHGRGIEQILRQNLQAAGWICKRDYPSNCEVVTDFGLVYFQDGVQSWINPRLCDDL